MASFIPPNSRTALAVAAVLLVAAGGLAVAIYFAIEANVTRHCAEHRDPELCGGTP